MNPYSHKLGFKRFSIPQSIVVDHNLVTHNVLNFMEYGNGTLIIVDMGHP